MDGDGEGAPPPPPPRSSFCVAVHNWVGRDSRFLDLRVGELAEVIAERDGWCYGRRVCRRPDERGVFPSSHVARRECAVDRSGSVEVVSVVQPQLVREMTHTLREWGRRWKRLYAERAQEFKPIEQRMRALIELRSSVLSGKLPVDQLRRVQRQAVRAMDAGNRRLGLDLTVRRSSVGGRVRPDEVSACRLHALHVETSEAVGREKRDASASPSADRSRNGSYGFFASVRNFVCKMTEDAELLVSLYDAAAHRHFTEHYVVRWSKDGLASDIDRLHSLRVLFTDLGTVDARRERVYLVCYVVRIGGMEPQNADDRRSSVTAAAPSERSLIRSGIGSDADAAGRNARRMRRPFGVAAMDVTHVLSGQVEVDDDKHHCVAFFPCEKDSNLETLLKKIVSNKELKNETKTGQALWISVKLLRGDLKQIREEVPHLVVGNVSVARKMGFPEVILPNDARNDLYMCLLHGNFTRGSTKSSDRNIQVTVRVCDRYGETIPGVIHLGGGVPPVDEYNSVVYYHEDKPKWFEIFKICVTIDEFKSAHVLFLFKHRSSNENRDRNEKPFAVSFTPLMQSNGTTLNDTQHCLKVYKVDGKKWSNDIEAASHYLSLPFLKNTNEKENIKIQKGFLSLSPKDSFVIETTVCSTKLTQNVELLGVLNWCDHDSEESLKQSLLSLQDVPGSEIVKFLPDILDALFSILTQVRTEKSCDAGSLGQGPFDCLVFECLLFVILLVSDRKYHKFQPVLDLYIKETFCATLAYKKLCSVLSKLILEKTDQEKNDVLLKSMKCLEYLMRFIVKSRELHAKLTQRTDQHDFQQLFLSLLNSIIVMMQSKDKSALTSQGSCIKYLPAAIVHIIQVFPDTELSKMVGNILDVLPLDRLTKQRLMAVYDLVQGPLFQSNECRFILLPHITQSLKIIIENNDETSKYGIEIRTKNRSVDKIARLLGASKHKLQEHRGYSEELELCLKILGEILDLQFRSKPGEDDREFNHISSSLLRTIILSASQMDRENPLVGHLVSVLLEMLRQMNLERYNAFISKFINEIDLITFIIELQLLLKDLVQKPVFLPYWADMINLQNNIILKTFQLFSHTLTDKLLDNFNQQVWSNWFHLAIAFLTQPSLQLDRLSSDQRRRLVSHFGDMRTDVAVQIKHMWFSLGHRKILFVPELVSPFLEMSLIPEEELRRITIPLFFDMMDCEYNSPKYGGIPYDNSECMIKKGNFDKFEDEMIHKLDTLVEGGLGDEQWRNLFCENAENQWTREQSLKVSGDKFVKVIGCLMDTLLQYRASRNSSMDHRMQATTTLLDFYSKIKRPEMYIRYVNKLCDLHLECENWTEAALTLRLHATLLQWSNATLNVHLKSQRHPDCQSHRDLKEALYYDIINYLDKGRMWELALMTCKELVKQYEDEVFDYCNLSELHIKMANFYYSIMKELRPQPEYFRVGYYGRGFPEVLQNKVFVYRGKDYERLQEFSSRAMNDLPNAELMTKLTPPGEEILNSPHQFVQVNAVEPIMCENSKIAGKQICDQILKYYKCNEITKFRYSRPFYRQDNQSKSEDSPQNEFASLWLERTELEICDKLPGIIRWFPVIKSKSYEMSPLEVAIETMDETNKILKSLIIEHKTNNNLPLDPLTRKLNGLIDPAVMGGIEKYEEAFFAKEYLVSHPEHKCLINSLKEHIAFQIPLLEIGIDVHRSKIPDSLVPLHQRMVQCFEKMKSHVHENYGKKIFDLERETNTVTMRRQMYVGSGSYFTDNRWSEISTQTNCSEPGTVTRNNAASSFKNFTSQINKQINRGSFSAGTVSVNLGLNTPTKKKEKEKRKMRKQQSEVGASESPAITGSSQWYTGSVQTLSPRSLSSAADSSGAIRELTQEDLSVLSLSDETLLSPESLLPLSSTLRRTARELVPSRPLRSEVEKERRLSQRPHSFQSDTNSSRNSAGSHVDNSSQFSADMIEAFNVHLLNSSEADDDPPPLPTKTRSDQPFQSPPPAATDGHYLTLKFPSGPRHDYDLVAKPRGSFLYGSMQGRNGERKRAERAPTPPPKRRADSVRQ